MICVPNEIINKRTAAFQVVTKSSITSHKPMGFESKNGHIPIVMCSHDALTNVAFGLRAPIHLCHQSWAHNCQRKIVYPIPWIEVVLRSEWAVIVYWVAQAGLHSSIV